MVLQQLPSLILSQVHDDKYLVFKTDIIGYNKGSQARPIFRWKALRDPLQYVGCGVWKRTTHHVEPDDILIEKTIQGNSDIRVTICTITPKVLDVPFVGQIPVVRLTMALAFMPEEYSWVSEGGDKEKRWHFVSGKDDTMVMPAPVSVPVPVPVSVPMPAPVTHKSHTQRIPPHIVNRFIEMAIEKGDTCPITMSPFTKGQVAMLVCGHLFERSAIQQSLQIKEQCPVCRQDADQRDILTC